MNFDYQQTQAEVTYQLVGIGEWAFKKVAALGSADINAGPENELFETHRTEMGEAGWALVSMAAIPGTRRPPSASNAKRSQTSTYDLFWTRLTAQPAPVANTCTTF